MGWSSSGAGPDRSGFLSAFFTLVGTHGLHVSVGLIWILVMVRQVTVKGLTAPVTLALAAPRPVLAFPGHRLGRDLLDRVSAGSPVNAALNCGR